MDGEPRAAARLRRDGESLPGLVDLRLFVAAVAKERAAVMCY